MGTDLSLRLRIGVWWSDPCPAWLSRPAADRPEIESRKSHSPRAPRQSPALPHDLTAVRTLGRVKRSTGQGMANSPYRGRPDFGNRLTVACDLKLNIMQTVRAKSQNTRLVRDLRGLRNPLITENLGGLT